MRFKRCFISLMMVSEWIVFIRLIRLPVGHFARHSNNVDRQVFSSINVILTICFVYFRKYFL